jgi:hypothetical protein
MEKSNWVMDYETMANLFLGVFEHYKTEERYIFIVHNKINHLPELIKFLERNKENKEWHISFNGLAFDSQITEFILRNKEILLECTADEAVSEIYLKSQMIIDRQNQKMFSEYSERDLSIPQIDIFKLNHWDNPAKRSSLKWIQYSTDWTNLQEMPIHHSQTVDSFRQINLVKDYCCNDVKSTKHIMSICADQINLRGQLTSEYKIPLFSASEPRISKELFLFFLSRITNIPKWDLKQLRTRRTQIKVSEILLPYIKFERPEFQNLLEAYKKLVIDPLKIKGAFKYGLIHKGVTTEYGLGGLHGAIKSGIYEETEDMIIMSSDVTSFYPNLAIRNGWAPAHLPKKEFCDQYEWFFEERKKIPKKDPRNYVYKIILNSTYGLSIEENSFLYDPQFGMQITINGQMCLTMLYEMLSEGIPGSKPLMQNTDGLEMMVPKEHKQTYLNICKKWEELTLLQLEHDQYSKMIIRDVNNYIAVYTDPKKKPKCKGTFEFEDLALHKNKSFLIIRKALFQYFVHNVPVTTTLAENNNIFDYCGGVKIKGDWKFQERYVENGVNQAKDLQNTIRYYLSNKGRSIVKVNKVDGREILLEAKEDGVWLLQDYSNAVKKNWEDYDINFDYYLFYINKEINNIIEPEKEQLELDFDYE